MKKVLSLLLITALLSTLLLSLAGCGKEKIDSGTEAAKLLLANERLDEKVVGQKVDVGLSSPLKAATASYRELSRGLAGAGDGQRIETAVSESHTWDSFREYSPSLVEFEQFMGTIDHQVERAAADIARMKDKVGITDKWVEIGREMQLLRVFETYDVLFVINEYGDIYVYYRYTDENAKNVYELYYFMSYEDGTTGEIRVMLIPGERYEYMYNNSGGFNDYFIGENSRGYWVNTRIGYVEDEFHKSASFSPYIIKDGLGYGAFLDITSHVSNRPQEEEGGLETLWYTVFDPYNARELFRISDIDMGYAFELYTSAIRSGLVSVSADVVDYDAEEGVYMSGQVNRMVTSKGTYRAIENASDIPVGSFDLYSGHVQHDYGGHFYHGALAFYLNEPTMPMASACEAFGSYASSLGLSLYCDMGTVAASAEHAKALADTFGDNFRFLGHRVTSIEDVEEGRQTLQEMFDSARAAYGEIKDSEVATTRAALSSKAHFAPLSVTAAGNNSFAGETVSLAGVSVSAADLALFETGTEYVLRVGLSLLDADGNPISVNTVPLAGGTAGAVTFDGGAITLTASGEYKIPKNLDSGTYAAVLYVATKEEGIRVSELTKIAFVSIAEGEIKSAEMKVEARAQNGNLLLVYKIANIRAITLTATKDSYTYDEIRRTLLTEVLGYGAPVADALPEREDGTAIPEDASLGKGTYRLLCYLPTSEGVMVQSYVYLTLK